MPNPSRSPGYAVQRDAEDAAALAGELCDSDVPERADLAELDRLVNARPFTALSLVKVRRLSSELIALNNVEDPAHLEERRIARRLAGEALALNSELFRGTKRDARSMHGPSAKPRNRTRQSYHICRPVTPVWRCRVMHSERLATGGSLSQPYRSGRLASTQGMSVRQAIAVTVGPVVAAAFLWLARIGWAS
jgi:hypothetical protein